MFAAIFGCAAARPVAAATVVEFYNTVLDNYFITADANEATQVDNGAAGPGWIRTGGTFQSGGSTPVCRFYGSQVPGPNSHFYTVSASECQILKDRQFAPSDPRRLTVPSWNFESLDFVSTPPVNDACAPGTVPVYRAYNQGFERGADSNHRITASLAAIQEVVARGWKDEGVRMCAPPEPTPASKITVSIGAGLPPSVAASIVQINTLFGSGGLGVPIDMIPSPDAPNGLVVALDSDDNIRLAAIEIPADAKVVLTADSTAVAMVRIAIGALPEGRTAQTANQIIRGTTAYPALVAAISKALTDGVPVSTTSTVLIQIAAVVEQSSGPLRAAMTAKAGPAKLPLPYSLLGTTGSIPSVHLVATTTAGKINLRNSLPIFWQARTNSSPLVMLPICDYKCILLGGLLPWEGPSTVQLPDADGAALTLHLEQNSETRWANAVDVIRGSLGVVLSNLPGGSTCDSAIASALLASNSLDNALTSIASFKAYLRSTSLKGLDWGKVLEKCAPSTLSGAVGSFAKSILGLVSGVSEVTSAIKAGGIAVQLSMWALYFDASIDIKVCEGETDNPNLPYDIANCAAKIQTVPRPLILAVGAKVTPTYKALDANGADTALPVWLTFTPPDPDPAVVAVNADTGALEAKKAGEVELTAADPSIPLNSKFSVTVADLKVEPVAPTVAVGETVTLRLLDPSGRDIVTKGVAIEWHSTDTSIADLAPIRPENYPQSVVITGKKKGTTAVYAFNPVSGQQASVNLVVTELGPPAPNGTWRFTTAICRILDGSGPDCTITCDPPTTDYTLVAPADRSKISGYYPAGSSALAFELTPYIPPSGPPPPRFYSGCYLNAGGTCDTSAVSMQFSTDYRSAPSWSYIGFIGACGFEIGGTAELR
jgi:hypothetical protein